VPGGAAEKAGLHPTVQDAGQRIILGDLIVAVDGKPIRNSNDLYRVLDNHEIGDTVKVTVRREDRKGDVEVTLQAVE
jgi:S1-C subfamily serine protease